MSTRYFALLTNVGAAKLANATALGIRLNITQMAVGDGGGVLPTPNPTQTALISEKRRAAINTLSTDPANPNQIISEQVIPENEGGWWIREVGLFDDAGDLIAIANCPETYKPQLQEGSGRIQTVRMILIVSSTDAVTLKIDPAVVLATRDYVDNALAEHEKNRKHPDGTLTAKGFVQLSNATNSDSEQLAATPKAVKAANDNANGRVPSGRRVNGKALTADITLGAGDVGALPVAGTAAAAAKLATERKIAGVAFDGSADIALSASAIGALAKDQNGADIPNKSKFRESVELVKQASALDATANRILLMADNGEGPFGLGSRCIGFNTTDVVVQLRSAVNGWYRCSANTVRAPSTAAWTFLVTKWDDNTRCVLALSSVAAEGMQFINIRPDVDSGWIPFWDSNSLKFPLEASKGGSGKSTGSFANGPNYQGTRTLATFLDELDAYGNNSAGSASISDDGGSWHTYINVKHRSGVGDGVGYSLMIEDRGMTSADYTGIVIRKRVPAGWLAPVNMWHSGNLKNPVTANDIAGMPQLYPGAVAPSGWLKCNGQAFDRTLYPVLASRYPSGVLPDLRGEFVRGWDDGRGADTGRALLSQQGDAIRNITGQFETLDHSTYSMTGVFSTTRRDGANISGQNVGQSHTFVDFDASRVVPTASENRPRNIAFNYIVRAA
ncbi:phage tail protein [Pectobacterium aroidearum]|uniref:phage tail-collar fiber domain-containing protein n=1 Tax=Pectobacterium aroidearum TaxID=1201031 RepID=UPI00211480B1|nr:phage tail protein [Pectobacterium aroidearum]UUE36560.1 phage tail protein [Pectobacterium aroidearum]UUE40936.1 phage tail protein [Pectobacterium aroidearum]